MKGSRSSIVQRTGCWQIFFTKPLQGNLFRKIRDVVLGYKHVDTLKINEEKTTAQERVRSEKQSKDYISPDGKMKDYISADGRSSVNAKRVTWADIVKGHNGKKMTTGTVR